MKKTPIDVDSYIASTPKELQGKLNELRQIIRKTIPDAKERISYSMPYYDYYGRLAYFALAKEHIGLYIPPPIIKNHKKELENYETTKSAVHLHLDKELPVALIKKLVKARAEYNKNLKKK